MNENRVENGEAIAKKLIKAIEQDEQIASSNSLNWQAVRDNLPAICQTIIKAIVYQLVTMLEGKIELISEVNKGSTFIVIIPIDRQSHPTFKFDTETRT